MHDSKPQRYVQQLKRLKVTLTATNGDKHINEASKQTFANICSKYHVNTRKVSFPIRRFVSMFCKHYYNDVLCILSIINESVHKTYLWGTSKRLWGTSNWHWGTSKRRIERQRWLNPAPTHRNRVASEYFCFLPWNVDGQHLVLMRVHECRQGFQTTTCAQAQGQAT